MSRLPDRWRHLATLGAAGTCATALALVIGTSSVAAASAHSNVPYFCGRAGEGTTSWSTTVGTAHWNPLRTVWVKQPPGCHDYNIVQVSAAGNYAGYLEHSNGSWTECSAGYIAIPGNTNPPWVECTSVLTNTHMTTDTAQFPNGVTYWVNY